MSPVTAELKAKAEVYHGDEICREKFTLWLREIGLPDGLLTIQDIEECGYVKELGFVWLKLQKKREHKFDNIVVCYDREVTAYVEPRKIKKLTGVKAKEFLVWITLSEIYIKDPPQDGSVITFKSLVGLSLSFPVSLFKGGKEAEEATEGKWWKIKL
ncbi:Protein of unknown function, DUF538 [Quillaja saponaria]|uniref:Uncharacterized protein n=1 Tax=Quillaja saponaria TaxID=32244 RepID=A0AAD7QFC4_QUISA|nr:Protein of unknown function, DUF538 [Quillaja saponaria]